MYPMRSRESEQRKYGLGNRRVKKKLMIKNSLKESFDMI
jgi:hypothetical protein